MAGKDAVGPQADEGLPAVSVLESRADQRGDEDRGEIHALEGDGEPELPITREDVLDALVGDRVGRAEPHGDHDDRDRRNRFGPVDREQHEAERCQDRAGGRKQQPDRRSSRELAANGPDDGLHAEEQESKGSRHARSQSVVDRQVMEQPSSNDDRNPVDEDEEQVEPPEAPALEYRA